MIRRPLLAAALVLAALPALAQQSIVGSWKSTEADVVLTFADDGTYVVNHAGHAPVHGTWTMTDAIVGFTNDPGSAHCDGVTGTWSLLPQSEGSIAFVKIEDDCAPREKVLPLPWTPVD